MIKMLTSGFFNSKNHDRRYNAQQFGSIFDGIINDGIYMTIGDHFNITVSTDHPMELWVGSGRAWFDHGWVLNDSIMILPVEVGEIQHPRKDIVVIETNWTDGVRANSIKIIKGEPSKNPVAPTPIRSALINQYPLATIDVPKTCEALQQGYITNHIGTGSCPFVTGPLKTIDATAMLAQWNDQWTRWYNGIRDILSDVDPGGSLGVAVFDLQQDVQNLEENKYDKSAAQIEFSNIDERLSNITNQVYLRHIIRYGTSGPNNSVGDEGDVYIQIMS